jgi:hypothetical protein
MPELVLTPEQSQLVAAVNEAILVRDADGKYVGCLQPSRFTPEEIEEAIREFNPEEPGYTSAQVLSRLEVLAEAEKRKGSRLEPAEADAILKSL